MGDFRLCPNVNFCSLCAAPVVVRIPDDDNRPRHVCTVCGEIHYINPKVVVGCLAEFGDRILMCRRAIEPRYGKWTLPAGFLECGETLEVGALRETMEEAGANVQLDGLYTMLSIPHASQIYVMFRATLAEPVYSAGTESLEVALLSEAEIPWDEIAFSTIHRTLRHYFEDRRRGRFDVHVGEVAPSHQRPLPDA
jgi:ADP-ribose pyrophosphatase YjhB (NUDIX family)